MTQSHYFIAVPIDLGVKERLGSWNELEHPPFQRFVHKEDYHITLVFLGGIEQSELDDLQIVLNNIVKNYDVFVLAITELGVFGQKQAPRIFWAGVKREEKLYELQKAIFQTCVDLGMDVDKRGYNPHITLARKYIGNAPYDGNHLNESFHLYMKNVSWSVSNIVIYKTNLDKVPKYEIVASFPLRT